MNKCETCKHWKHDEKDRQDAGMYALGWSRCTLKPIGSYTHKTTTCEKYAQEKDKT